MYQESLLTQFKFKYLKISFCLIALCSILYFYHEPKLGPNGGTWLGYTLGTLAAIIIILLMLFGLRKRAYKSNMGTLKGWLSAHVYLGMSLIVITTLHSGFSFGWNIHTVCYVLTITVVLSGIWGVFLYLSQPNLMANSLNGKTLNELGKSIIYLEDESRKISVSLPENIQVKFNKSICNKLFAYPWQRYFGSHNGCKTKKFITYLKKEATTPEIQELYKLQIKKNIQLTKIREFLRMKGWMEIWLMFHVPLSFALLATLIAHTVSVFFYW